MFNKKVINYPGFWKSVVAIGIAFLVLYFLFRWILADYSFDFIGDYSIWIYVLVVAAAGFIYGFFVTYGKFWKKLKEKE